MQPGKPDPELLPPAPPSLVERLVRGLRARAASERAAERARVRAPVRPGVAIGVALLIAAGPLLTIVGAHALSAREEADAARLRTTLAPRLAAERSAGEARAMLARVLDRPALGATLEGIAAGLPEDATLVRVARTPDGLLEIDVATPDPDRLRTALRRSRALARMRDMGQRSGDGAMITSLREVAP